MSDLVERLRAAPGTGTQMRAAREAADVLERIEAAWHRGMTLGDLQYIVNDESIDLAMTDIWDALHGPQPADEGGGS